MKTESEKEEFLHLIEANKAIIYKICNSYCQQPSDREDLAQEIIYQLWKSGKSFKGEYKFSTWMYRVALNVAISFYRKRKTTHLPISLNEYAQDVEDEDDGASVKEENINRLQQFINELKELDRALMILYLEEKSYKEISEILGISETNVATRISRNKENLKQKFATSQK
ncbi:MAG: RNA polymerase sigma factor [Chitinophagaceae bacterium]